MTNLRITGTGAYLPEEIIDNSFFEGRELRRFNYSTGLVERVVKTSEDIVKTTGIRERRRARSDESASDMGYNAAVEAIERANIHPESLVGIILATVTERPNVPSGACKIQEKLRAKNVKFALDINFACAGSCMGLISANSLAARHPGNYLVIGSEVLSKIVDYNELDSTLFGDGAGAAVLEPCEEHLGLVGEYSRSEADDETIKFIHKNQFDKLRLNGAAVFKKAIPGMIDAARGAKEMAGWEGADVYIPHQANARIISGVRSRLSDSIVYENIQKYGNMSAATCLVALHEAILDSTIKKRSRVVITAFGAGPVSSAVAHQSP